MCCYAELASQHNFLLPTYFVTIGNDSKERNLPPQIPPLGSGSALCRGYKIYDEGTEAVTTLNYSEETSEIVSCENSKLLNF